MHITLKDIFSIQSAVIYYPDRFKSVSSVSIDTRTIKKNSLFVAIKGKNFDGHNYVQEAISKGAIAIVVSNRKLSNFEKVKVPIISVNNTIDTYAELAKIWRNKLPAKVISITGSNGKTTTKEILAHLLSAKFKVHKTFANNNNKIGVPLTIFSTPPGTDFVILEHGTNHFGEIEYTAKIAQPDFGLITNIGNSHTKYLESKDKIFLEKSVLFKHIKNAGLVFINNDDRFLKRLKKEYSNNITFGFVGKCLVKANRINTTIDAKYYLKIIGFGKNIETRLPLLGRTNSQNYLSAVAVGLKCGLSKTDIVNATKTIESVKGRLEKVDYDQFTIIDDTYNSNPQSVKSALNVLKYFKLRSKKVLVIGDMLELGESAELEHMNLATEINHVKLNSVFGIGKNSKIIINDLTKVVNKKHFNKREDLKKQLLRMDIMDSVFLVKGSRGMKMEDFVEILKNRAA